MAGIHEKMQTDYIWVREHSSADENIKTRTHGFNYLYYHVPNLNERMEMIYRSIGKQYDWDLEKFRMQKKFPDRGNKRRLIKNFFRFMKHPFGYLYWKTYRLRQARGRIILTFMTIGFLSMFWKLKMESSKGQMVNAFLLRSGKNVEGPSTSKLGFYDSPLGQNLSPLGQITHSDLGADWIVVNPCRNQNYRKYFEMRKKYGIQN